MYGLQFFVGTRYCCLSYCVAQTVHYMRAKENNQTLILSCEDKEKSIYTKGPRKGKKIKQKRPHYLAFSKGCFIKENNMYTNIINQHPMYPFSCQTFPAKLCLVLWISKLFACFCKPYTQSLHM